MGSNHLVRAVSEIAALSALLGSSAFAQIPAKGDGYRGIWYSCCKGQLVEPQFRYKYSGGLATFPQTEMPMAYYSREANKTFFCYGGTLKGRNSLFIMVSYYDHATGEVPRPTILLDKETADAHDTATLTIDDRGYIWVFSSAHGNSRPAFVHKSKKPYSIDQFDHVMKTNFSYMQPWYFAGTGFLLLHTRYFPGDIRNLFWVTSRDGVEWNERKPLARTERGHYSISWRQGDRIGLTSDYHPQTTGGNWRTNLYYLETKDQAKSWYTVEGKPLQIPLTEPHNPALVHDYKEQSLNVYLNDLEFDRNGRPVILYLTSRGWEPGPANEPRSWNTARWTGKQWQIRRVTSADHNYDLGSLHIEPDGVWRIIAPTDPGPQPWGTGGEVTMWISRDEGKHWKKFKQLTHNSSQNHSYIRKPFQAHPDFYAFWTDGNALQPSECHLYFTNKNGDHVWKLPPMMTQDYAKPEIAW